MIRFIILDPMPRCFYIPGHPKPSVDMLSYPWLLDPGQIAAEANWRGSGITTTLTITLDNRNGELSSIFASPPLQGRLENDQKTLFEGEVDSIELSGSQARIGLVV